LIFAETVQNIMLTTFSIIILKLVTRSSQLKWCLLDFWRQNTTWRQLSPDPRGYVRCLRVTSVILLNLPEHSRETDQRWKVGLWQTSGRRPSSRCRGTSPIFAARRALWRGRQATPSLSRRHPQQRENHRRYSTTSRPYPSRAAEPDQDGHWSDTSAASAVVESSPTPGRCVVPSSAARCFTLKLLQDRTYRHQ